MSIELLARRSGQPLLQDFPGRGFRERVEDREATRVFERGEMTFGATGFSIARRYVVWVSSGGTFMAAASRGRLAWRLVRTGNFVPLTFSKSSTGRRFASRSSLTTSAVSSYRGSTG